jgi:hypothetical protein
LGNSVNSLSLSYDYQPTKRAFQASPRARTTALVGKAKLHSPVPSARVVIKDAGKDSKPATPRAGSEKPEAIGRPAAQCVELEALAER